MSRGIGPRVPAAGVPSGGGTEGERRRALLLGCPGPERLAGGSRPNPHLLRGVPGDLRRVQGWLTERGFACQVAGNVSRGEFIREYQGFIDATQADDIALVYYSGHGARVRLEDRGDRMVSFLVTRDFWRSKPSEGFLGVLALELSLLQQRLTARTRNVTVVLDCCHAAHMSRGPEAPRGRPKALDLTVFEPEGRALLATPEAAEKLACLSQAEQRGRFSQVSVPLLRQRLQEVEEQAAAAALPASNPDAVRLVACGPQQVTFEYGYPTGETRGALTDAWGAALARARGRRTSWLSLGGWVRDYVRERFPHPMEPNVEGPARRILFSLDTVSPSEWAAFRVVAGGVRLGVGRAHGVRVGDVYALGPPEAEAYDPGRMRTRVRVSELDVDSARGVVEGPAAPRDGRAFLCATAAPRQVVRVELPDPEGALIREVLARSHRLRAGGGGEPAGSIRARNGRVEVLDHEGQALSAPLPPGERSFGALQGLIEELEDAARARDLRRQYAEAHWDEVSCDVARGLVGEALADQGLPTVHVGDRIYVRVRNRESESIFVSILDFGISGRVTLLSHSPASGVEVPPGGSYTLGQGRTESLEGLPFYWPAGIPTDRPREEWLFVLASSRPIDLRPLSSAPSWRRRPPGGPWPGQPVLPRAGPSQRLRGELLGFHLDPESR